ncbi:hypothetical protein C1I95_17600 [Micromonospora craterilacus]|uniref:Uncharacterized protein n=1 Tax=Micromonospora craterilacus TaxID=1655439 RepID=A0A2W2F4J6_9ACTN|nr:hypothetical protein [Micromonospora craterilacus]PZG16487.1 hypothetical protein C1I95_17600 [Micromonospora craterilacus]
MNTALAAGSDPVRLAAKLRGYGEGHAWVEGSDRAWLADIIDQGLEAGIYRRGLWRSGTPDGPRDQWTDLGWQQVIGFLRSRDDEPVVTSYSVTDGFPNRAIADWTPPVDPQWRPDWADGGGANEWSEMTASEQDSWRRDHAAEQWYDLPDGERWELAMAGLRRTRPWARLAPDTLSEVAFGWPVSVYDLFAPDSAERVRAAAELAGV